MLNSLLQIGEQLFNSDDYGPNYLIFYEPKLNNKKEHHYVLEIVINCDVGKIIIDKSQLKNYDKQAYIKLKNLTLSGNTKKFYVTASFDKIKQIAISFWGKNFDGKSQLLEEINNVSPELDDSIFVNAIKCISELPEFSGVFDKKIINEKINLAKNEEIVLVTVAIINSELGITQSVNLGALEGYAEFLEKKLLSTDGGKKGINYVNGAFSENVDTPQFLSRYNLNYLFVTTTVNSLNNFKKKNAKKNYQIDTTAKFYLEIASKYVLNNLRTTIAGLQTVIVPRFSPKTEIDFLSLEPKISNKIDIAFTYKDFSEEIDVNIGDEVDENIFWVNFITFDSGQKKYFKIYNQITDVPYFRFLSIIGAFKEAGNQLSNYNKGLRNFNLYGFYKSIPVNKSKSNSKNINKAFLLIQDILGNRKIDASDLFESYSELVRAYYYKRTGAYSNISDFGKDNFDYRVNDAVFAYLTIFNALMKLGILDNHNFNKTKEATMLTESPNDFGDKIEEFFKKMGYSNAQKALFYLGRMLNAIAYQQSEKNHKSKPILNKLNFNGMDKKEIIDLQYDLFEKARQYGIVDKIEFDNARFTEYFEYNNWNLKPEESLFFILSGYSFGLSVANKKVENSDSQVEEEINDEQQLFINKEN